MLRYSRFCTVHLEGHNVPGGGSSSALRLRLTARLPNALSRICQVRHPVAHQVDGPSHLSTRSNVTPLTLPPPIDDRTLRLKPSRFALRSSAASLFSGSDAFGSRKRNYSKTFVSILLTLTSRVTRPAVSVPPSPLTHTPLPSLFSLPLTTFTYLQPHNNRIQIQHRFPILPQNIQAHIPLEVDIRVVDFLHTLYFLSLIHI